LLSACPPPAPPRRSRSHASPPGTNALLASPARLHRGKTTQVTFIVRDAGDPVAGAKVKAQGKSGVTNAKGKVTLALEGRKRSVLAYATATGYVGDDVRLRVLRK
jgi:hypothetical protein